MISEPCVVDLLAGYVEVEVAGTLDAPPLPLPVGHQPRGRSQSPQKDPSEVGLVLIHQAAPQQLSKCSGEGNAVE